MQRDLEKYKIDHTSQSHIFEPTSAKLERHKLVPKFDEPHVPENFLRFEKITIGNEWPKERWSMLAQSVLVGKALRVFDTLSVKDFQDSHILKETVLHMNEFRPKAYLHRYRNFKKHTKKTYIEFCKYECDQLCVWLNRE